MRGTKHLAFIALLLLGLTGCASPDATASDQAHASQEELTIYVGRNEAHVRPLIEAYERSTGTRVSARYASTGELATTLLQEGEASPADLFFAQDPVYMGAVEEAGLLAELPERVVGTVVAEAQGDERRWVAVTARQRVLAYNPQVTPEDALPDTLEELTDPVWKGQVGVAPTHSSFVAFVAAMIASEGEAESLDWLRALSANEPQIYDGNEEQLRAIASGDLRLGLVNNYYLHRLQIEDPATPIRNHNFATGDAGSVVIPTTIGMLASSTHRAEALQFIEFLLSAECQEHFRDEVGEYPMLPGAGAPEGQPPLDPRNLRATEGLRAPSSLDLATDLIAQSGLV